MLAMMIIPTVGYAKEESRYYYEVEVKVFHYALDVRCTGKWTKLNKTASGTVPEVGRTIAHGTLEFGTEVEVDGKPYVVEDRGSGISGNNIDIFVGSYNEAVKLGTYKTTMKVFLPEGQVSITHVVKSGETLSAIASKYNIDTDDIAKINGITNVNSINSGQELIIPVKTEVVDDVAPMRRIA